MTKLKEIMRIWSNRSNRYSINVSEEIAKNKAKIEMSYIGG